MYIYISQYMYLWPHCCGDLAHPFHFRYTVCSKGPFIQIGHKNSKKSSSVQFSSFGLPRFQDYFDELKTNAEKYLNNKIKRRDRYNLDEFERFVKDDIYSICGKKPIIKLAELE